ncbi:MAG: sigma-70 family RNA polymerase sigma factor [Gemmatimonadetes bacterium]|nr:sigma-70 family RNA polymerase sigma factor [Gemmatimonadota bacterium]MBI2615428.1 sigma-70 family RNA polymerase sigma factor [Gemmatimonadota bacterium]
MRQNPDPPRAAFEQELLSAIEAVHRFAVHLTRDPSQAEDLVQETYLRALAHRDQYQPGTNCRAWLFTICRNAFLKGARHSEREVATEDAALEALAAAGVHAGMAGTDPEGAVFERPELADAIRLALEKLPEEFRTAVVLVDMEDQSYAEAARVLGVPVGTVRSRLFRGRRLLQGDLLAYAEDAGLLARREENT